MRSSQPGIHFFPETVPAKFGPFAGCGRVRPGTSHPVNAPVWDHRFLIAFLSLVADPEHVPPGGTLRRDR